MCLKVLSVIDVVLTCYSNVLTSGSPVANPKSGTDYSVFGTFYIFLFYITSRMFYGTSGGGCSKEHDVSETESASALSWEIKFCCPGRHFLLLVHKGLYYRMCITWIIHQQIWEYKVEEKLHLGVGWMPLVWRPCNAYQNPRATHVTTGRCLCVCSRDWLQFNSFA
jgi:hypothetical protein